MNIRRIYAILYRQICLLRGSLARIVPIFTWPLIDIVLWGFITKYLSSISAPGTFFISTLLGAMLMWNMFIRVMHGLGISFLEDVWQRNFFNVFASPIRLGEYLTGLTLTAIMTSLMTLCAMVLMAALAFDLDAAAYALQAAPFLLMMYIFAFALGIAAIGMVLHIGPAAEWFMWPLPAVLSPFAGIFYPLSILPAWMQVIGHGIPVSYAFEGLRAVMAGGSAPADLLITGFALSFFYLALSCGLFGLIYRKAVDSGRLARYSAESY